MWAQKDSNLRSRKTADLQSAHVGRLWNVPKSQNSKASIIISITDDRLPTSAFLLSHLPESNQRPTDYKSVALPSELKWLYAKNLSFFTKGIAKVGNKIVFTNYFLRFFLNTLTT